MKEKRVFLIVLDSVGVGNAKDAKLYGDEGSNTLSHIIEKMGEKDLSYLKVLGVNPFSSETKLGAFGVAQEKSKGKGTIEGHWEMTGIETVIPFDTFESEFPKELLNLIKEKTGYDCLGNCVASGTEIIAKLGKESVETNKPIFYTSADSVFQIAAHEETFGLETLYKLCEDVREILTNSKWNVSRVIARPFVGENNNYQRTPNRKDYSTLPPENNLLTKLATAGIDVVGVGKINDIFAGQGVTSSIKTKSNTDGIVKTMEILNETPTNDALVFVNLVDFDMKYGHRRDVEGYFAALKEFNDAIPYMLKSMKDNDILIITADHGCDPTYKGTDHTRENVPIAVVGKNIFVNTNIGTRNSFADIGQTIAEYFDIEKLQIGTSFLNMILGGE